MRGKKKIQKKAKVISQLKKEIRKQKNMGKNNKKRLKMKRKMGWKEKKGGGNQNKTKVKSVRRKYQGLSKQERRKVKE